METQLNYQSSRPTAGLTLLWSNSTPSGCPWGAKWGARTYDPKTQTPWWGSASDRAT